MTYEGNPVPLGIHGTERAELTFHFYFSVLLLLAVPASSASAASNGSVLAVELQGAITPASDDIVLAAIGAAEAEDATGSDDSYWIPRAAA